MKNLFLNGVSFLPLYAPEKGGGEGGQAELELNAGADADIAEQLEAAADDDQNDLNHSGEDEDAKEVKAGDDGKEPEKAEGEEEPEAETEDEKAELEQLRKANKALGKRISALSKDKRELHAKLQENIREVPKDDAEAAGDDEQPQRSDFKTKAEFDAAVAAAADRVAAERLAAQEFNRQCNAVEAAGSKAFGDKWPKAKAELAMLDDHGRIPIDILSVALETENPARVLFVLGNDIEKATELMGMTVTKRAIAMDKIASQKPVERQQSRTPAPVEPLGGRGARDDRPSDRDSDEEWNRKEEARERRAAEERRKRGY
jgi:hypothetical protein